VCGAYNLFIFLMLIFYYFIVYQKKIIFIFQTFVMLICMALYMMVDYGYTNHVFKINVHFLVIIHY
jgi:hypothetical protein